MRTNLFVPTLQQHFLEVDEITYESWLNRWETNIKPEKLVFEANNKVYSFEAKYNGTCKSTFTGKVNNQDTYTYEALKPFILEYLCYDNGTLEQSEVPSHLMDIEAKYIAFETFTELINFRDTFLNRPSAASSVPFTEEELAIFTETE